MAEHSAVNRVVVGSSPTWGAKALECENVQGLLFCVLAGEVVGLVDSSGGLGVE